MKELIKKYWLVIIIALIAIGSSYWYQLRPAIAHRECTLMVADEITRVTFEIKGNISEDEVDSLFKDCLRNKGINK